MCGWLIPVDFYYCTLQLDAYFSPGTLVCQRYASCTTSYGLVQGTIFSAPGF